jgi:hypothetical protein
MIADEGASGIRYEIPLLTEFKPCLDPSQPVDSSRQRFAAVVDKPGNKFDQDSIGSTDKGLVFLIFQDLCFPLLTAECSLGPSRNFLEKY